MRVCISNVKPIQSCMFVNLVQNPIDKPIYLYDMLLERILMEQI